MTIELPGVADRLLAKIKRQPIFMGRHKTSRLPNRTQRLKRIWKQLLNCSRRGPIGTVAGCLDLLTSVDLEHLMGIFGQRRSHFRSLGKDRLSNRYLAIRRFLREELLRRNKRKAVKEILEEAK